MAGTRAHVGHSCGRDVAIGDRTDFSPLLLAVRMGRPGNGMKVAIMKLFGCVAVISVLFSAPAASAAETRCGWLENPTPANWWLTDKDASWTLMTQGEEARDEVMENLPSFEEDQYVATNGNYGYGCACLSVDVDGADERIIRVYSGKMLPLARCMADKALPRQE